MAQTLKVNIADNGRMVLPRAVRELLGVKQAGVVILSIDGDEVKLESMQAGVKRAQALYKKYVVEDFTSDDFLRERKLEAERENLEDEKYLNGGDQ
jgi:bifunctional DNA-binding transcriptional regulator/antitoxin component of YhaV-PrlF toxin-antitoxin module